MISLGFKVVYMSPGSVAQLVATWDNLCRGQGSNSGFPTSPHIMCMNLATKLLEKKKIVCMNDYKFVVYSLFYTAIYYLHLMVDNIFCF